MPLSFHKKITGALLFQWFKFLGRKILQQENDLSFWQANSAQAFRHLKKECNKRPILQAFDWKRISTPRDLQRLAPIGPAISGQSVARNRNLAFSRIFSHLANAISWNFFNNHWLILSSIYDSSIAWSEIPRWFRPFCKSNAESHDATWTGIYLDCRILKETTTRDLLKRRSLNLSQNPALVILEADSETILKLPTITSSIPKGFTVVPFWVEEHQPLAIWDLGTNFFRWLPLGQSLMEITKETEEVKTPRTGSTLENTHGKTQACISNPNMGFGCGQQIPIQLACKAPLLFSIHPEKEIPPVPKSSKANGINHPLPCHPQKSEIGAKL